MCLEVWEPQADITNWSSMKSTKTIEVYRFCVSVNVYTQTQHTH